jgi:hypothetical protein
MPTYLALFLGLAALLLQAMPTQAASGTRTSLHSLSKPVNSAPCHITQVILHGTAAPTINCRDGQKGEARPLPVGRSGPLARLAFQDVCFDDALVLYWNANEGGPVLCVNGSGVFNLTSVSDWNDNVSSFWTGCYNDYFYQDVNRGGGLAWAPGSPDGDYSAYNNFPLSNVGNDQLSSVWQYNSYGGDQCA